MPSGDNVADEIRGRTITDVRPMTQEECDREGWPFHERDLTPVLVLDDGTKIYPSQDDEGNGPGALFGHGADLAFRIMPVFV